MTVWSCRNPSYDATLPYLVKTWIPTNLKFSRFQLNPGSSAQPLGEFQLLEHTMTMFGKKLPYLATLWAKILLLNPGCSVSFCSSVEVWDALWSKLDCKIASYYTNASKFCKWNSKFLKNVQMDSKISGKRANGTQKMAHFQYLSRHCINITQASRSALLCMTHCIHFYNAVPGGLLRKRTQNHAELPTREAGRRRQGGTQFMHWITWSSHTSIVDSVKNSSNLW